MSAAKCWRRCSNVPYRQKAGRRCPRASRATVEGQTLTVKGPKGTLSMQLLDDLVKYEIAEGEIRVTPLDRRAAQPRRLGHAAHQRAEPRHRRDRGLHQGARDHRRRLPRPGPGQEPAPAARLQPRRQLSRFPKASTSRLPTRTRSRSAASTSRRSARSRPKSAAGASPSRTRARASSTAASISSAKKARRSSHGASLSLRPPPPPRPHRASRACRRASRGFRSTVRAGTSMRRSSTMLRARRSPRPRPWTRTSRARPAPTKDGAAAVGKAARRARQEGRRVRGRVRPWRLPVPWPGEGPRRRCPRRRTGVLNG